MFNASNSVIARSQIISGRGQCKCHYCIIYYVLLGADSSWVISICLEQLAKQFASGFAVPHIHLIINA